MVVQASAPGKLFLIGEYAVLDGAPALLSAVDRRVHVSCEPAPDGRWRLTAANLGIDVLDLGADLDIPAGLDAETRRKIAVFEAVRAHSAQALGARLTAQHVTIDSQDFAQDGHKLGLGSSAAVAAALTAALSQASGETLDRAALSTRAIAAHRTAQNGRGSGGDVATAVYGGLISYTRDQTPIPLTWPADLAAYALVTGTGASTPDLVARVADYGARAPEAHRRHIAQLHALADRVIDSLAHTRAFIALAADYFAALCRLDAAANAGIVTAQHFHLAELAAPHGGTFKSSGAGGGDVGLVFTHRGDDEKRLHAALERAGARFVDLAFGAPGLRCETRQSPG
ncbi:hypothetical protein [Salinisphaera sp.]|uniref:mevalonate kinase family protein n=1 Tax=Salinisphaera sp. TaxID=1914330 RepID=UPI0025E49936|nr:hypothetical protein [Salinisphaera sp.]